MKLFQRLLVAPAALGLLSPLAANATEVNLNEIANYSDVESIELANTFDSVESSESLLLAGGEGLVDSSSYDGSFSQQQLHHSQLILLLVMLMVKILQERRNCTDGDEDLQLFTASKSI